MTDVNTLITEHLDIWTSSIEKRSGAGRGNGSTVSFYGIKKLRELILELAVRGKLVPHSFDRPQVLGELQSIQAARRKLEKKGKAKPRKKYQQLTETEMSFVLPDGWIWVRLQEVSEYIQRGKSPQYADEGAVQVISQKCVQWLRFEPEKARFIDDSSLPAYGPERFLRSGDILWNSTGTGTVGRVLTLDLSEEEQLVADSHVTVIRLLTDCPRFIEIYLSSAGIQRRIEPTHENALVSGTTKQVELNVGSVMSLPVPLPPLAEQKRIVAKVDELVGLCDAFGARAEDSLKAHQTLVETCLATLTNSLSPEDLTQNWTRLETHFNTLFATEESVESLIKVLVSLAVRGRLLAQAIADEKFERTLQQIQHAKRRLCSLPGVRKKKSLPKFDPSEAPFNIPSNWVWVRLDDIVDISGGITKGRKLAGRKTVPFPYLRVANVQRGYLELDEIKKIEMPVEEVTRYQLQYGDLLITEGGDWDKVGRTAIWREEMGEMGHQNHVFRARKLIPEQSVNWIETYLNSSYAREYFGGASKQTTNLASINMTQLRCCMVPMPPIAEQQRIIGEIDRLKELTLLLRQKFSAAERIGIDIADALTSQMH